jgi:hypothetical protein
VLPDESVAVHVTVVVPAGNTDPDGGTHTTVGGGGQLSVAIGVTYVIVAVVVNGHDTCAAFVIPPGHPFGNTGGCVSFTVTVKLHIDILFDESFTVHVTVVVPFWKVEPDAGTHIGAPTPGQLSLTIGAGYVTTAWHTLGSVLLVTLAGHVMFGAWVSLTVTVNEQLGPAVVQVTVVVPFGKNDPDAGEQATVPQPPPVVVGANVTTAPHWFGSLPLVMFAGQVIVHGFCTVILNVQLPWLFDVSVTVHVTVVIPTGKHVPDAGVQLTGLGPSGQLSLPLGVA